MPERITLTIETHNEAFDVRPATEVARIMKDAAKRIEQGDWDTDDACAFQVRDANGDTVGRLVIEKID